MHALFLLKYSFSYSLTIESFYELYFKKLTQKYQNKINNKEIHYNSNAFVNELSSRNL